MKLQIASDLHLEFLPSDWPATGLVEPHPDADLLVLAGDIHNGIRAIELFKDCPVPVLYVPGNHEFYGEAWEDVREALKLASIGTAVHVLDKNSH